MTKLGDLDFFLHNSIQTPGCILSIAVARATARQNRLHARWPDQRIFGLSSNPGLCAKLGQVNLGAYGIGQLGSQLSRSSTNLVPAKAGKVTVGLESH